MARVDVSIIIVNYNGRYLLPTCLESLSEQTIAPEEVIVVDNASSDGSLRLVQRHFPWATILPVERNLGFGAAANRGVLFASSPLVCVLNPDARPEPGWLAALLAAVEQSPAHIWSWGSVLVSSRTGRVESAGDQWSNEGYAYKLGRDLALDELPTHVYEVFAAPGAAPLFRRDRFALLGGYYESFFLYYEDVDLAYRAVLQGWRALLVPTARVHHDLGSSGIPVRVRFYVARNSAWTAVRCIPDFELRRMLRRMCNELRWNRPRRLAPVELLGRCAALAGLLPQIRRRCEIQNQRVLSAAEVQSCLEEPPWITMRQAQDVG